MNSDKFICAMIIVFIITLVGMLGVQTYIDWHKAMECKPYLMEFKFQGDSDG